MESLRSLTRTVGVALTAALAASGLGCASTREMTEAMHSVSRRVLDDRPVPASQIQCLWERRLSFGPRRSCNQQRLNVPLLIALAASLKLSTVGLRDALAEHRFLPRIQADFAGGVRSGVNGTPTFFINGMRFDHPAGAAGLPAAIDAIV